MPRNIPKVRPPAIRSASCHVHHWVTMRTKASAAAIGESQSQRTLPAAFSSRCRLMARSEIASPRITAANSSRYSNVPIPAPPRAHPMIGSPRVAPARRRVTMVTNTRQQAMPRKVLMIIGIDMSSRCSRVTATKIAVPS